MWYPTQFSFVVIWHCVYMWPDLRKGVLYTHPIVQIWSGITSFISKLLSWKFLPYKCNDRPVLLPNFKTVGQTPAELHSLKVEKLDACIRSLFCKFGHIYGFVAYEYFCNAHMHACMIVCQLLQLPREPYMIYYCHTWYSTYNLKPFAYIASDIVVASLLGNHNGIKELVLGSAINSSTSIL